VDEYTLIETYRSTIHQLYRYVSLRCGGDRALAEDVTQEAWLRAVVNWRRKGLPDEPLAWLTVVARNLLSNYFRSIRPVPLDQAPAGWEAGLLEDELDPDDPDLAVLITWGFARLKKDQAELLDAFHLEGRKVADIAEARGLSERAVEGRLRRARQALRRILEPALAEIGEWS
jgi:RNA polymerase sigma-70 factor (ECF subfamily)